MSKYAPLQEFLSNQKDTPVMLTYQEMENLIGFKLPNSAYRHRAWWSNGKRGGSKFWLRVGWMVDSVALGQTVSFRQAAAEDLVEETKVETLEPEDTCDVMISLDLADIPGMVKDLQSLMVDGIISRDEFEEKKNNLLAML